ncbi:MAG: HAD family phosphatase [Gammaproteobacteria bacterium]
MTLALFDLDNTLLANDSDYLWGEYLCNRKIVDPVDYDRQNKHFYQQYERGEMDIDEFLRFALEPLRQHSPSELLTLRDDYLASLLPAQVAPGTAALLQQHHERGDTLVIITATNRFISAPIARYLGVNHLIATLPSLTDGNFDGGYRSPPCYQQDKLTNLNLWLATYGLNRNGSYAYSDSHNDLPLLEWADHPVAVDPDPQLRAVAEERNWPVISLRQGQFTAPLSTANPMDKTPPNTP